MLGQSSYSQDYIDTCRARVAAQIKVYKAVGLAASKAKSAPLEKALDGLEPVFFNNMVLVLDSYFTHRLRKVEGKDGNPLNEVRMLCTSMFENHDELAKDSTIKWDASKSVLGLEIGDPIRVSQAGFARLADAFFADIEKKFT